MSPALPLCFVACSSPPPRTSMLLVVALVAIAQLLLLPAPSLAATINQSHRPRGGVDVGDVSVPWQRSDVCLRLTWKDLISPQHQVRDFEGTMEDLKEDMKEKREQEAKGLFREELPAGGLMKMAFATPVFRVNVSTFVDGIDVGDFNDHLESIIWNHYQQVLNKWSGTICKGQPGSQCDANNAFFGWQSRGGYETFFKRFPEFVVLEEVMIAATKRYMQACGIGSFDMGWWVGAQKAKQRWGNLDKHLEFGSGVPPFEVHPWATVHDHCQAHLTHDHPKSMVSGTYYVKVPPGSGPITLYDPRHMFNEPIVIHPRAGELLLFPSWLAHQVMPTAVEANQRMSVAFNAPGYWAATMEVGTSYALPRMPKTKEAAGSSGGGGGSDGKEMPSDSTGGSSGGGKCQHPESVSYP